jgi:HEPN domain-containing protein
MALDPPSRDVAAFHCQQAAEKLLKGILVQAHVDCSGIHDLERLGRAASLHLPTVAPLVQAMDGWTEWNSADSSSDMAADPGSGPSAEELSRALEVIAQLDAALRLLAPPESADPL